MALDAALVPHFSVFDTIERSQDSLKQTNNPEIVSNQLKKDRRAHLKVPSLTSSLIIGSNGMVNHLSHGTHLLPICVELRNALLDYCHCMAVTMIIFPTCHQIRSLSGLVGHQVPLA